MQKRQPSSAKKKPNVISGQSGTQVGSQARLKSICVFCGSGPGKSPAYMQSARTLGEAMAQAGIRLVYGGGSLGLMGEVAHTVLNHGGRVTGIIPEFLSQKEKMLKEVDDLIVTQDMHERKRLMFEHSDAFVALPGGVGTLEELIEQLTWSQLGRHDKPIVIANIDGFWNPLKSLLSHMREEAFIRPGLEVRFNLVDRAEDIVTTLVRMVAEGAGQSVPEDLTEKF